MVNDPTSRTCIKCGETKPDSEFYRRHNECKICTITRTNADSKRRRQADPIREWAVNVLAGIRIRSRKFDIPFDLTLEVLIEMASETPVCPIFGVPLQYGLKGRRGYHPYSPSVDRVVPTLGYVRTNVIIISNRANTIKNNATPEELMLVANFYSACPPHLAL